jgi:hypothetical protein
MRPTHVWRSVNFFIEKSQNSTVFVFLKNRVISTKLLSDHLRKLDIKCFTHGPSEEQTNLTNGYLHRVQQY